MAQLNLSFGSGGMTSSLDNNLLAEYFQYVQPAYDGPLPIKKAVLNTGRQANDVWVLNSKLYISEHGDEMSSDEVGASDILWINKDLIYENDKISSADISPRVRQPLTADSLTDLIDACVELGKHNLVPTLLVVAGTALAFHYETVVELYSGCPITVAIGEAETGKSTAIRAGLSLCACDQLSLYVKGTNAAFLERSNRSTLPFGIEEGARGKKGKSRANQLDMPELIIELYNGSRMTNLKSGTMKPRSIPVVASNFDVEDMEKFVHFTGK